MTKTAKWIGTGLFLLLVQTASTAQELGYFIDQAEAHNPQLEALRLKYDIAGEKKVEAGALPDTEIGAGLFVSEPETRTGPQKARFSLRQMLPWFGSITARQEYAGSLAEVEYLDWVIARRKLRLEVAERYYELQGLRQKIDILGEQGRLLDSYREVALTSVETGRASMVDVLRIDIRKNDLSARQQVMEARYQARAFAFFKLLNTPETVMQFPMAVLPEELPEPQPPVLGPHPELEQFERLYESVTAEEALNRKSAGPNLGFGLDFIPVAERTDMVVPDNGKDIWMPMVSFSVPLFNTRYRSRTRQNQIRQESLEAGMASRRNQLESMLEGAWQGQLSERIRFTAQTENRARTRQAIEILLKNYQTDTADFSDLLEMQEMELKWQLERTEALAGYLSQGALVNYLTAE